MTTAAEQKITVTDTMSGRELKSTEVRAVLDQPHAAANFAAEAVRLEDEMANERWGKTLDLVLAETRQMMADADVNLTALGIRRHPEPEAAPEPVAEVEPPLPPNPYNELAPDRLDADHAERTDQARAQRRTAGWTPDVPDGVHPPSVLTEQEPVSREGLDKLAKRVPTAISAEPTTQVAGQTATYNETPPEPKPKLRWWEKALSVFGAGA